jgi:hypothetical protein
VSPVRYELGFYIPEDGILLSHGRGNLKSHIMENILLVNQQLRECHSSGG